MTEFAKKILEEYPHKIELHTHTANISRCSQISIPEMITSYKYENYSGITITNHFYPFRSQTSQGFKKYVEDYIDEYHSLSEMGENYGIRVYLGMEISFLENPNDYLVYGIDEDFIRNCTSHKMKKLEDFLKVGKNDRNLIIQAHPFRNDMQIMPTQMLDGIEVYNMHPNHNSRNGFAAKYAEETGGVFTCGTDFHHAGQNSLSALLTKELPEDSFELAKCIKNNPIYKIGNSVVLF